LNPFDLSAIRDGTDNERIIRICAPRTRVSRRSWRNSLSRDKAQCPLHVDALKIHVQKVELKVVDVDTRSVVDI
jgi:hypothetical protein